MFGLPSAKKIIGAVALAFAAPAVAEPITLDSTNVGESFTINYDGFSDGVTHGQLGSSITFTLTGVQDGAYTFDYSVANLTDDGADSRISSFSFNTDPDISGATSAGAYPFTVTDSNYPNGIGTVDVCFKAADTNSCAGNADGVAAGETGSGSLTLNFADPLASLTLTDFFVRYQGITGIDGVTSASGQLTSSTTTGGSTTSGGSTSGTPVPEPGMMGMFAAALIGLGLMRRRRRSIGSQPAFA